MSCENEEYANQQIPSIEGLFHIPTSISETPYLIGSKCKLCGHVSFPKRAVCPVCVKGNTMEEIPLSRRGKIRHFCISRVSQPGFPGPYVQAFVRLYKGPEIFSIITGVDPDNAKLRIGTEVELVIEKIAEDQNGNNIVVYKFAPVRSKSLGGQSQKSGGVKP